jgi:hypothetical protein
MLWHLFVELQVSARNSDNSSCVSHITSYRNRPVLFCRWFCYGAHSTKSEKWFLVVDSFLRHFFRELMVELGAYPTLAHKFCQYPSRWTPSFFLPHLPSQGWSPCLLPLQHWNRVSWCSSLDQTNFGEMHIRRNALLIVTRHQHRLHAILTTALASLQAATSTCQAPIRISLSLASSTSVHVTTTICPPPRLAW